MACQFKAGDRVRVNSDPDNQAYAIEYGYKGTLIVDHVEGDDLVCFDKDGCRGMFSFRLAPAPTLIDPAKTYRTRDGRDVRIYATDGGGKYPVHGAVKFDGDDEWYAERWTAGGAFLDDQAGGDADLIEVKPEREYWLNIYSADIPASLYLTKRDADAAATPDRIACIRVKFTEGEGLA